MRCVCESIIIPLSISHTQREREKKVWQIYFPAWVRSRIPSSASSADGPKRCRGRLRGNHDAPYHQYAIIHFPIQRSRARKSVRKVSQIYKNLFYKKENIDSQLNLDVNVGTKTLACAWLYCLSSLLSPRGPSLIVSNVKMFPPISVYLVCRVLVRFGPGRLWGDHPGVLEWAHKMKPYPWQMTIPGLSMHAHAF